MQRKVYWTPRALLMHVLENEKYKNTAHWIVKNQTFAMCEQKMIEYWTSLLPESFIARERERRMDGVYLEWNYGLYGSIILVRSVDASGMSEHRVINKSTEPRRFINDLEKKELVEWIILFLLEQSRTDWLQWWGGDRYTFKFLDIQAMGQMFAKVHGRKTSCAVYYTRLILSSYCLKGIMTKIGMDTYQFDAKWFIKELTRTEDIGDFQPYGVRQAMSLAMYPQLTTWLPPDEDWNDGDE